jgi:hypothetical protein
MLGPSFGTPRGTRGGIMARSGYLGRPLVCRRPPPAGASVDIPAVQDTTVNDRRPSLHEVARHQPWRIDVNAEQKAEFQDLMHAWSRLSSPTTPKPSQSSPNPTWMLIGENGPFPRDQFLEAVRNGRITHPMMSHEIHEVRVRRASHQ